MAYTEQMEHSYTAGPLAPPRRESKNHIHDIPLPEKKPMTIQNIAISSSRKPSLSIVTKVQITVNGSEEKARTAPVYTSPPTPSPNSPSMNPLQRLSNLASLMVYVIWFDIPLCSLLQEWNMPGNRYFKFRSRCETMLSATRLSPSVVVVGLKYMERVKQHMAEEKRKYPWRNEESPFKSEGIIWAACLLLSHKYLDDKHYSNPVFAGVNKITITELNVAERECLRLLDFKLAILENEYADFRKSLQSIVTESIKSIGTPTSSTPSTTTSNSPTIATITSRGPANAALLYPKSKRISPYQAPVSPGILAPENTVTWSPDSPLLPGGPLRPRDKKKVNLLHSSSLLNLRSVSAPLSVSAPPRTSSFSPHPDQTSSPSPMDTSSSYGPLTSTSVTDTIIKEMDDVEMQNPY